MMVRFSLVACYLAALLSVPVLAAGDPSSRQRDFVLIAGDWRGIVTEIGLPRYEVVVTLAEDGSGRAVYPGMCSSVLSPTIGPRFGGRDALLLTENIVEGKERCADGLVELALDGGRLRWLWRDFRGELRAAGSLVRMD